MAAPNTLYYGDNLDILRRYVKDESVDLIYLDPPFKSNQDYNVLFAEKNGSQSSAQIKAFEDTWHWDQTASLAVAEVVEQGGRPSLPSFRVATITDLLEQGVPLEDVQQQVGHADPRTTRLYDRRQRRITRNIVERISI